MAKRIAFIDGFEDYPGLTTSGVGVSAKWAYSVTSNGQPTLQAGRVGGRSINLGGNSCLITRVFDPSAEIANFFACQYRPNGHEQTITFVSYMDSTSNTTMIRFAMQIDGFIYAYDGAGNLLASAAEGWIPNTWHSFSVTIKIHETEGLVTLRRDGEPIINVTNINTVNGSHTTIDRVRYQAPNVEFDYDHELWYDDVRVDLDTIDYIPEGRYALLPYASDDSVAWTPSTAGDNYPMIDEGTCDQDSTYNTSNVVGDRDVFNLGTLDFNPNKIYAVVLTLIARKEDVATRRVKAFIQNGLVESPSEDMYLTTNYTILPTIFETNPDGDVEWDKASVEATKPGYELVE